jgi:hypothetical protein
MSTRATRRERLVSVPTERAIDPDECAVELSHPSIHGRAMQAGAWRVLVSWARAS